jgi:rhodanese-related sulfurtransferase
MDASPAAAATAVAQSHNSNRKPRPVQRDLRIELCGRNNDRVFLDCFHLLRSYRLRYHPLIRPYYTAVGGLPTTDKNNEAGSLASSSGSEQSVLSAAAEQEELTLSTHFTSPTSAVSVEGVPFLHRLHASPASSTTSGTLRHFSGEAWLRDFLDYRLLGLKLRRSFEQQQPDDVSTPITTSSAAQFHQDAAWPLFVRHFIDEGSRTASFIIAHLETKIAVVVDPPFDLTRILSDLATFELKVHAIFLTHLYMDVRTGHKALQALHCGAVIVWCGSVWPTQRRAPAASSPPTRNDEEQGSNSCVASPPSVHIGDVLWSLDLGRLVGWGLSTPPSLSVRGVWAPAGTDDAMILELFVGSTRVAVFAGTSLPLDGCVRHDLRRLVPSANMTFTASTNIGLFRCSTDEEVDSDVRHSPKADDARCPPVFLSRRRAAQQQQEQQDTPQPQPIVGQRHAVSAEHQTLHATLAWVIEEYFGGTLGSARERDGVVVFPSHGGYNHLTHQLDLHWAAHVADLKRYSHVKRVYELVLQPPSSKSTKGLEQKSALPAKSDQKNNKHGNQQQKNGAGAPAASVVPPRPLIKNLDGYIKALPQLPKCAFIFQSNRAANLDDIESPSVLAPTATVALSSTVAASSMHHVRELEHILLSSRRGLVLDVRPFSSYAAAHIPGSVNIPMTFPGFAIGAKKAELWLSCTLGPSVLTSSVIALCALESDVSETRIRCLHVGIPAHVLTVASVESIGDNVWSNVATVTPQHEEQEQRQSTTLQSSSDTTTTQQQQQQQQQQCESTSTIITLASSEARVPWKRLSTVASLDALSTTPTTLVVDVRTPYEYKNGSHRSSVHFALADLCSTFASAPASQLVTAAAATPSLALRLLTKLHDDAIVGGADVAPRLEEIRKVIVYCAAGYRSHIAVSIIKAALETEQLHRQQEVQRKCSHDSENASDPAAAASRAFLANVEVVDVAGGALHIMLHRPDMWLVKDRSIICIS